MEGAVATTSNLTQPLKAAHQSAIQATHAALATQAESWM